MFIQDVLEDVKMDFSFPQRVYWCARCNVPLLNSVECPLCGGPVEDAMLGKGEIRPVFEPEKEWYRELLNAEGKDPELYLPGGMCFYYRGSIVVDGQKVFRVSYNLDADRWEVKFYKKFRSQFCKLSGSNLKGVIEANLEFLERAELESLTFINDIFQTYQDLPKAVSFSGGKDSVVTLFLIRQLMPEIDVIFLNTGIAFPETEAYVNRLRKDWGLNLIEVRPTRDFFELCEELGPPSQFMKWCCKTQKFAPMNHLIETRYDKEVVVASGVRRNESNARNLFKRIQRNQKIPKQILFFPILEWNALMVWLYILWKKIPINEAYKHGISRIGCWACPEKKPKHLKIIEKSHPALMSKLKAMLIRYAKTHDIKDVDDWISSAKWRLRASKYERTYIRSSKLCSTNDQILYTIRDSLKIKKIKEFVKVFGEIERIGKITKIQNKIIDISIIGGKVRAKYLGDSTKIRKSFARQLEKALNCVNCGACVGSCKIGALKMVNGKLYVSDDCIHCLNCLSNTGLRRGCISLNYGPKIFSVK